MSIKYGELLPMKAYYNSENQKNIQWFKNKIEQNEYKKP